MDGQTETTTSIAAAVVTVVVEEVVVVANCPNVAAVYCSGLAVAAAGLSNEQPKEID